MVNLQDTPSAGQISAADLAAARQHSTGRILHMRRAVILPHGCDGQGRYLTRQWGRFPDTVQTSCGSACAPEGGKHAEPVQSAVESMWRHRRYRATAGLALALALVGAAVRFAWPLGA